MKLVIYTDAAREYRWHIVKGSRIVANGGEGYKRLGTMTRSLKHLFEAIKSDKFKVTVNGKVSAWPPA